MLLTNTGRLVHPLRVSAADINIRDIAHALSHINRFNGHSRQAINVAWHSVWVSRLCKPEHAKIGLLHDAPEAYLGDVIRGLKRTPEFGPYRAAEDRAWRAISDYFGLPRKMPADVIEADNFMVRIEGGHAFGWRVWDAYAPPEYRYPSAAERRERGVANWRPADAISSRKSFLAAFKRVG